MDELVHHCLRELSFDGDLGCDVSRLRDFIIGFYSADATHPQVVDDAFCAFVWSLVVQQPTVRVGTPPVGISSEVYIAPQTSARRKAAAKGEEHIEEAPPTLNLVPDARDKSLEALRAEYGDGLRIAVDPETSFVAITGSHIRPSKLSPMVYSALQLITRGRETGITTVELGKKTKYDQKTCFYVIKQLLDLGLVIKARRGGVGNHSCIHKYFVERSALWKQIHDEEAREKKPAQEESRVQIAEEADSATATTQSGIISFDPIDSRHLSSLPLVRNRIVTLLKASKNYIHASNNLLMTIGFSNPIKTDRRFFQTRLRELIQQGVVERVMVPSNKAEGRTVKCIRLITPDNRQPDDGIIVDTQNPEDDEKEVGLDDVPVKNTQVIANRTIHKQVSDLLEEAGSTGMTLNDICTAMGNFDKRTIELLLTRSTKNVLPPHLSDLGTADVMETFGREHRHRYYTIAAYRSLVSNEQLQDSAKTYGDIDLSKAGEFAAVDASLFYDSEEALHRYQDTFKDKDKVKKTSTAKLKNPKKATNSKKRKRGDESEVDENDGFDGIEAPAPKAKRGRPRKKPRVEGESEVDDIDGSDKMDTPAPKAKKDRPRKQPRDENQRIPDIVSAPTSEPAPTDGDAPKDPRPASIPETKKRGRPSKISVSELGVPRKRGRPPKKKADTDEMIEPGAEDAVAGRSVVAENSMPPPKKRGRAPKKKKQSNEVNDDAIEAPTADSSIVGKLAAMSAQNAMSASSSAVEIQSTTEKRNLSPSSVSERPAKRTKRNRNPGTDQSGGRLNLNISHLRRENEILRVIQILGGIANLHTKDFFDAHLALLETLSQTGEPASAPVGTRIDKRTANATIQSMEERGRIKILKTSVVSPTGASRPACLVYPPETPQESINRFLHELGRTALAPTLQTIKVLDEPMDFGADRSASQRSALPLKLLQMEESRGDNAARAEQLFSLDANVIREVLLTERTTLSQLYGYLVGKAVRIREFHLFTLGLLDQDIPSSWVVSRDHRIIDISCYHRELSLSLFCAFVAVLELNKDILAVLQSEDGRQTSLQHLSPKILASLQVGKARSRSRILDLMDTLRALGLATPLEPTSVEDAEYICPANDAHPTMFKKASLEGWTVATPMTAPQYWHFTGLAPLHLWAVSEFPPYWRDMLVRTRAEGVEYWQELHKVCMDREYAESIVCPTSNNVNGSGTPNTKFARILRRKTSWDPNYMLTWHQKQFLRKQISVSTGHTPLDDEDADAQLQHISHVISVPRQVIVDHLTAESGRIMHEKEKTRRRLKRIEAEEQARQSIEAKAVLQKKAIEAKLQREQDWENLIHHVHPEPLKGTVGIRIRVVRSRFLQSSSTKDAEKWTKEIQDAIKDTQIAAKKIITKAQTQQLRSQDIEVVPSTPPLPIVSNLPEKPVVFLISQQGPPLPPLPSAKSKGKGKAKMVDGVPDQPSQRRGRFQWNREYDELARDTSAIIRARGRDAQKIDLSPFDQIFPPVPRNSVRNRVAHLRENPADDAYMKRLEDRWYALWSQYRGTIHLPDEDPQSLSNFNIIEHIEFLRKHIDKNALRVGFVQHETLFCLPSTVDEISNRFEIMDNTSVNPAWDFLWITQAEEGREKRFVQQAFTKQPDDIPFVSNAGNENVQVAEAALKMVFGTPHEHYDSDIASALLRSAGQQAVSIAIPNLLRRGTLSKLVRDSQKSKPGRTFKISDVNSNAIGGSISRDVFQDACVLEDLSGSQEMEWRDWPLVASDGDVAALLELVSDDKVDFEIDLAHLTTSRSKIDWNSKKADDDDIETGIRIRFDSLYEDEALSSRETSPDLALMDVDSDEVEHGRALNGSTAACKNKGSQGPIDCISCLGAASSVLLSSMHEADSKLAQRVLDLSRAAGPLGLTKSRLLTESGELRDATLEAIYKMTTASLPPVHWVGYNNPVLVSSDHIKEWSVITTESPRTLVFPRRWLDIRGLKVSVLWEAALRAVVGVILFRPGISQASHMNRNLFTELRWRLRAVYDRQEIVEILCYLQREGFAQSCLNVGAPLTPGNHLDMWLSTLEDGEEQQVFWFIQGEEKHWYRV
ncbi:hypothetical protein BJ138DRAFT_998508 [Hygrophoropsis aurantiaca]|uniref:Uncharacterized protein n=1 Tax=Hygrophoropsis aurantiaca TaxID=72124 RepID=A0ACB8APA8_9AGAM|nr:hypothetical protein BJ138DRAFT_998508 [Hygrophoropsis aurantiaca]